ncbi:MAG: DUF4332 domain-containing protein, partial [Cytophagales bacterium]|nr:DUF4332 domain-containing protein [Cytophagales bacterium]
NTFDIQAFIDAGVPKEWLPVLEKAGINSLEKLKAANPNKLFNDMGGLRKKLKLEIPMVSIDEIKNWVGV